MPVGRAPQVDETEWLTFPGGELEGQRPRALCPACRARLQHEAARPLRRAEEHPREQRPLCFQCYRAELDRERALNVAADLNTASNARFQCTLPFEPVNRPRLQRLRAERARTRVEQQSGVGRYADKRRQAQIAARHALQQIAAGLRARLRHDTVAASEGDRSQQIARASREWSAAVHAAELQLPESWLPFVVSR
jgi:hypothetical protein